MAATASDHRTRLSRAVLAHPLAVVHRGLVLSALLLAAPAAHATTLIARCEAGAGASFVTSPLTAAEIALMLNSDLPTSPRAGATLVLRDDAAPQWTSAAPRDIHAQCGG